MAEGEAAHLLVCLPSPCLLASLHQCAYCPCLSKTLQALAWAANRGPLAARRWSFASFAAIQLAPITPREGTTKAPGGRQSEHGGGSASLIAAFAAKAAVMVAGLAVLRLQPPQLVVELLYSK